MRREHLRPPSGAAALRRELSARNMERAAGFEHELTFGSVPTVVYQREAVAHGNFIPASYRSILANADWEKRLRKSYSGRGSLARPHERKRCELDCANSSDALLMNIFCYPKLLYRPELCALLGIDPGLRPAFGFKPRIPFLNGKTDRTEVDMSLGSLLVEAKLTETGFQTAAVKLLERYRDLEEVFHLDELAIKDGAVECYQLLRGVLAAHSCERPFMVLCDSRRPELIECWFRVMRAVRSCSLRNRLQLLTWQELANVLPGRVQRFIDDKYGIVASSSGGSTHTFA